MREYLPILLQEFSQYSENETSYTVKACILETLALVASGGHIVTDEIWSTG
jgi:hypothetical protein